MIAHNVDKVKTDLHTVSIRDGKEKVVVIEPTKVPDQYVEIQRKVNKTLVMASYKEDGEIVDGCDVVRGEPVLSIR